MSKIEYLSLEGLRVDGRRLNELRNAEILCGGEFGVDVINYDGMAQVTQGLTKVQAFIKGPIEMVKNKQRCPYETKDDVADIQCEVIMPCEKRSMPSKSERQTADLMQAVITTFERIIIPHQYKNSSIQVFVNILEADGGVKSTVLNAVLIALVDAGIAMNDLIAACTCIMLNGQLFIGMVHENGNIWLPSDPNQLEINGAVMELTVAFSTSTDEIIYIDLSSEHPIKSITEIIESSMRGSKQFSELARTKLKKYAENVLELNSIIHNL